MDWSTAVIAAGAAIVASALTGVITLQVTRETLKRNSDNLKIQLEHENSNLVTQLKHERVAAREDRDQERRKDAYVALIKYVYWLSSVNLALRALTSRRVQARAEAHLDTVMERMKDGTLYTTESAAAVRAAFFGVNPTSEEQERLDARPGAEEDALMRALVTAVATDAVFEAFGELLSRNRDLSFKMTDLAVVVVREPKSLTVDDSMLAGAQQEVDAATKLSEATMAALQEMHAELDKASNAALQEIEDTAEFHFALIRLLKAGENFDSAVKNIVKLMRTELNFPQSVEQPVSDTGQAALCGRLRQ